MSKNNGRYIPLPEPEDVPVEARYSARGLKRWLDRRRTRQVPELGWQDDWGNPHCAEGCKMHDHGE